MPAVASSAILAVGYEAASQRLDVTFVTGRRYVYADVPRAVYYAFLAAPSKGEYFNARIRDRYAFVELT